MSSLRYESNGPRGRCGARLLPADVATILPGCVFATLSEHLSGGRRSILRADRGRPSAPFGVRSDVRIESGVINVSPGRCDLGQALHELVGDDRVRVANAADVKQRVGLSRYRSVPQS